MTAKRFFLLSFLGILASCGGVFAAHAQTGEILLGQNGVVVDPDAFVRLGDLYYDGNVVEQDMKKAFAYYSQAAVAGSETGKIRIGEMLARGESTKQDIERGRSLVQEVSKTGNSNALVALGELYTQGDGGPMSPAKAMRAFEAAASKGNVRAMIQLGDLYRNGRFQPVNGKKALEYYRRAAKAGNPYGQYGIGYIYLERLAGKTGTRTKGIEFLRQAGSNGVSGAVVAISNSYFYGKRPNPKRALLTLEQAMQNGNLDAALELIAVYRDGKRDGRVRLVKRDTALARKFLHKIETKLSPGQLALESYLLDSATTSAPSYRKFYDRLEEILPGDRPRLIRELRTVNPGVYVYIVQAKLKNLQLFDGNATGKLSAKTARAMLKYCNRSGTRYFCGSDPMSSHVAEIISYAFR